MTLKKRISWFWHQDFDTQTPSEWFKELPKKKYCDTGERISYLLGNVHSVIPGACVQARGQIGEPVLFLECAFSEQLSWSIWKQTPSPTEPSAYFSLNPWRAVFCLYHQQLASLPRKGKRDGQASWRSLGFLKLAHSYNYITTSSLSFHSFLPNTKSI